MRSRGLGDVDKRQVTRVSFGALAMRLDFGVAGAIAAVSIGSLVAVSLQWWSTKNIAEYKNLPVRS